VKGKLSRKVLYELDGGDRKKLKAFTVKVESGAISVCVPGATRGSSPSEGFAPKPSENTS
jgi:hypothetical protein